MIFGVLRQLFGRREKGKRVADLLAAGCTIEVCELSDNPQSRFVQIDLGFGAEIWQVESDSWTIDTSLPSLRGGLLVTHEGDPVLAMKMLQSRGVVVEHIHTRV